MEHTNTVNGVTCPHYHAYIARITIGRGARAFTTNGRVFNTRQAASQWAARREPSGAYRMVVRCDFDGDCPRPKRSRK